MKLEAVTPLILTFNEESNIDDTLKCLNWASRIVVVDSYSSDATIEIAERFPNVHVLRRPFDDHSSQWNFGLAHVDTDWVLSLDSDYRCPPAFAEEICSLDEGCDAYVASFVYCINGRQLSGTLYPPRAVLYRPKCCHYVQDGHTQLLVHDRRRTRRLRTKLLHDDRKPITRWFGAQVEYAALEARKLSQTSMSQLAWKDRVRRCYVLAPILTFFYCLFVKRLILDGRAGLFYTLQRAYAELLLSLTVLDVRLGLKHKDTMSSPEQVSATQEIFARVPHELSHTRN
jgi:glycosyltransferase involved in cell wall biosynthesis